MIKCKDGNCPVSDYENRCCFDCSERKGCVYSCEHDPSVCNSSEVIESTDLTLFQSKAMVVMQKIADIDLQKKQLEAQDKEVRQELQKVMDMYGIKKFENDILKVTYIEPSTRTSIDSARLKKELPAVAEKYSKTSQVKGSVRIEVK